MAKLIVRDVGLLISIVGIGSYNSPFKMEISDNLIEQVREVLVKVGAKDFEIDSKDRIYQAKFVEIENTNALSEILDRVKGIEDQLSKTAEIPEKKSADAEEDIFIPSTVKKKGVVDLSVRISEKEDILKRVEALSKIREDV